MRLRWATAADASVLASLWHRTWHHTYARHLTPEAQSLCGPDSFRRRVAVSLFEVDPTAAPPTPRPTTLVAEPCNGGGRIAGFAMLRGGAELAHLYVAPEAHGTGLASHLLQNLESVLYEQRGCEVAHLSVAVRNLRAVRFYEKHGWVGTPKGPWMSTAPWQPSRPEELPLDLDDASLRAHVLGQCGLTAEERSATTMRGTLMKKYLGYDVGVVLPRKLVTTLPKREPCAREEYKPWFGS